MAIQLLLANFLYSPPGLSRLPMRSLSSRNGYSDYQALYATADTASPRSCPLPSLSHPRLRQPFRRSQTWSIPSTLQDLRESDSIESAAWIIQSVTSTQIKKSSRSYEMFVFDLCNRAVLSRKGINLASDFGDRYWLCSFGNQKEPMTPEEEEEARCNPEAEPKRWWWFWHTWSC